ncbi:MAG: anti-sigma factor [Beijerinckiaceae bacterium]|nr:anti-sigma factor [Beijerinckiaceae bacterium]
MNGDLDLEAAEFVLGTLDASERGSFAARLAGDKEAQAAVAAWESRLAGLADDIAPLTPPDHVWARIERALASRGAEPHGFRVIDGGASDATRKLRRSLARWRAATVVSSALAAVLLLFVGYRFVLPTALEETSYVAAVNRGGDQPALLVRVDLKSHRIFVRPVAAETPKGKSLELWYISDGKPPRSMGVIGSAPLSLPIPSGTHADAAAFAVSVEPPGGSPSGVATGPVIYSGQLIKE